MPCTTSRRAALLTRSRDDRFARFPARSRRKATRLPRRRAVIQPRAVSSACPNAKGSQIGYSRLGPAPQRSHSVHVRVGLLAPISTHSPGVCLSHESGPIADILQPPLWAMCGRIWTPIATDRLSWFRRSQLLTYIRLFEAAGQRLRREPRWVFARFHLNGPKTSDKTVPVHTSGSGSDGVTVSPSPAFLLQLLRWDLLLLLRPSGRFHRQFRFIRGIASEHRPDDSRVLVGKRHCRNICMSPAP